MSLSSILFAALLPTVVGLVEAAKRAGLPTKFTPIIAILFGIAGSFLILLSQSHPALVECIYAGIGTGLASVGLYAGTQATLPLFKGTPPAAK